MPDRNNLARRLRSHLLSSDWHISLLQDSADCSIMAPKGIGNGRHRHALTVHFYYFGALGFSENYLLLGNLTGKLSTLIVWILIAVFVNR